MKKILITVATLVLLYPVVVWLMGFAIEDRIDRFTDQGQLMTPQLHLMQKTRHGILTSDEDSSYQLGSTLKVTRHYHRGWYNSVDEATVEMSSAAFDALPALRSAVATTSSDGSDHTPFRFSLRTVIHHGPLCGSKCFALAGAETHVSFTGLLQASLTRLFGNEEPITIHSRFAFFGGGSATMSSPAFEHAQIGQDASLSWGGLDGTMHYGTRQDWYDVAATAPSLRLDGSKGTLQIYGMSLDLHSKRLLRTLYEGNSRMELKRLSMTGADKARQFTLNDLVLTSENHAQDRFMSASYQMGAGAISTQPLTLSSEHVDITWKHLGLESLESLLAAMRIAGQQQNASLPPAARAQSMMAALKLPLEALLLEQPEMDIDRLSVATAQGQGLVTGVIRLVGVSAADFEAPALLLRKLDVRLDLAIDEAFLSSLPGAGGNILTQLQPMIDQGYITRSNGALRTQILFREGQPTFNGKPFNPAVIRPTVPAAPGGLPPPGHSAPPGSPLPPGREMPRRATAGTTVMRLGLPPQT
jgi:uncharacterized protein YdgA (DUF945 family)